MKKSSTPLRYLLFAGFLIHLHFAFSQPFTKYDSLRGSLNPMRSCFDVTFYDLDLEINTENRTIHGSNKIFCTAVNDFRQLQLDLFTIMHIDSIVFEKSPVKFVRDSNAVFLDLEKTQPKGKKIALQIYYHGTPLTAKNPPWDGGFVWSRDSLGRTWVAVACEGLGASSWWPCKDHFSDEPDSMRLRFVVPSGLTCIANGNLIEEKILPMSKHAFTWFVSYPINTYNATLNIGHYAHFNEPYTQIDGHTMDLDYYVLSYHLPIAQQHFKQVKKILYAYERSFGPYPFPRDGYALVETPYWGMEHQSAVAYGNNYKNTLGIFDFIIVHETAHEWWGNSITASDPGELWIHESFATYSEALLLEYYYGDVSAVKYLQHQSSMIRNKSPMLKPLGVNYSHSKDTDIYYKGAWMLHTLRNVINNDLLWEKMIFQLCKQYKHSIVTTDTIIHYFNTASGMDLTPVFEQYLKFPDLPVFEYRLRKKRKEYILAYLWKAEPANFAMPLFIEVANGKKLLLNPTQTTQTLSLSKADAQSFRVMTELFYIRAENKTKKK